MAQTDVGTANAIRVTGGVVVYRLYDVGYEIHLDRAASLLASDSVARARPTQREAQALLIPNPPITVALGIERVPVHGAVFDAEMSARIFDFGVARRWRLPRGYATVLAALQTLVADSTELVERVENSFKVTDDVYLARVYSTAIEIFRGRTWRQGIDRKLALLRETYAMLHAEAQAWRAEILEIAIVVLIIAELVAAMIHR